MTHLLKIWPGEFEAVASGCKMHDVRRADRQFAVGDSLILREFVPSGASDPKTRESLGIYTGQQILRRVTYITPAGSWGLPTDVCVLSLGGNSNRQSAI
jgi:hypothetical protein